MKNSDPFKVKKLIIIIEHNNFLSEASQPLS